MVNPDHAYMREAISLALKARGETFPNPLVGAVIVKGRQVIARGWHRFCGGDHAEVAALKKAGTAARRATLYVTLEPCSHFGRTPPCVDRIIAAGIRDVAIAMVDPNPVNNGQSIRKLKAAGIKVRVGILETEARKINEPFIKYITQKLPFVTAKTAQTLDGKIALANGESRWITSRESRDFAHQIRREFDGILVGINTILKDNPYLNAAHKKKPIKKIIVDSRLRLPRDANIFKETDPQDILVATSDLASPESLAWFQKKNVHVIVCPRIKVPKGVSLKEVFPKIQLRYLFHELAKREISNVLLEGGAHIIAGALKERLIDKFMIFVSPKILGDAGALSAVSGLRVSRLDQLRPLRDVLVERLGEDLLIQGYLR